MSKKKQEREELVIGTIRVLPRGFGFVEREGGDVFVPKPLIAGAVDGDTVEVVITGTSEKGLDGQVTAIVERGRSHIAGTVVAMGRAKRVYALVPLLGPDKQVIVDPGEFELEVGSRIVMHVDRWGDEENATWATATSLIGHISDPSCDVTAACEEFQIRTKFPRRIAADVKRLGKRVSDKEIVGREDFRSVETVTVDPETAKDFDDAISLEESKDGKFVLSVHIADVSHYVRRGTQLDTEALERYNSTYFPGQCIPMLPPALSDNLCSLKPQVNRLAVTVTMHFSKRGKLIKHEICRSVIRSDYRFSYEEAMEVLEGKKRSKHAPLLKRMVKLCELLKVERKNRGSVEFSLPEVMIMVNPQGEPTGTRVVEYDITHQMIEEFMLKTNEVIATHLTKQDRGLAYRVHEEPEKKNFKDFVALAAVFGYKLSDKPTPQELQKLFEQVNQEPYGQFFAVAYIRSMKLAIYSPDNVGHYGLSLEHYCHFTSPIRRYADLIVHRVLFGDLYEEEQLDKITKACSDKERLSARAEMSVLNLKKLRYLANMVEQDRSVQLKAVVTKVKNAGISFELVDFLFEGFIHVSQMGDDYFRFDGPSMSLKGEWNSQVYAPGTSITVMIAGIDLPAQEARFNLVSSAPKSSAPRRNPKQHRGKGRSSRRKRR